MIESERSCINLDGQEAESGRLRKMVSRMTVHFDDDDRRDSVQNRPIFDGPSTFA